MMPAMIGERMRGSSTLLITLANWMALVPAATQVAPISPPNNACEELDGRPSSQVIRFQRMAPTSPPKITTGVIWVSSTNPLEIVLATSTDRNAPTKLRIPARITATLGRSASVAIEVAIALAVSWKPLVKSKMSAVITTAMTIVDMARPSWINAVFRGLANGTAGRLTGREHAANGRGCARWADATDDIPSYAERYCVQRPRNESRAEAWRWPVIVLAITVAPAPMRVRCA